MCVREAKEVKVTSPMTVYKVVLRTTNESEAVQKWLTPFQSCHLDSDIIEGRTPYVAYHYNYDPLYFISYGNIQINDGYIHCYGSIEEVATEYFNYYLSAFGYRVEVYECVIPVDHGEYKHYCWRGLFDGYDSVASRKIVFKRKLEESELRSQYNKNDL